MRHCGSASVCREFLRWLASPLRAVSQPHRHRHARWRGQVMERLEARQLLAVYEVPLSQRAADEFFVAAQPATDADQTIDVRIETKGNEDFAFRVDVNPAWLAITVFDQADQPDDTWQIVPARDGNSVQILGRSQSSAGWFNLHLVDLSTTRLSFVGIYGIIVGQTYDVSSGASPPVLTPSANESWENVSLALIGRKPAPVDQPITDFTEPFEVNYREDPAEITLTRGVVVEYSSETGRLTLNSLSDFDMITMHSASRYFDPWTPIPDNEGAQISLSRSSVHIMARHGRSVDLGMLLPVGLTRDDLTSDLSITALTEDGEYTGFVVSVDNQLTMGAAEALLPKYHTASSYVFDMTLAANPDFRMTAVDFSYAWSVTESDNKPPLEYQSSMSIEYSVDEGKSWVVAYQTNVLTSSDCDNCYPILVDTAGKDHFRFKVSVRVNEFSHLSVGRTLSRIAGSAKYTVDLPVHLPKNYVFYTSIDGGYNPKWFDKDGQLVATDWSMAAPENHDVDYVLRFETNDQADILRGEWFRMSTSPTDVETTSIYFTAQSGTIWFSAPIDLRTCSAESFEWIGSDDVTFQLDGAALTVISPNAFVSQPKFLYDATGSCRSVTGRSIPALVSIDQTPLSANPFDALDNMIVREGSMALAVKFERPVFVDFDSQFIQLSDGQQTQVVNFSGVMDQDGRAFLDLLNLTPGDYRLTIPEFELHAYTGNNLNVPRHTIHLTVIPAPPTDPDTHDFNRDGTLNFDDYAALEHLILYDLERLDQRFDFDHDRVMTTHDLTAYAMQTYSPRLGDCNLDGRFDQRDLQLVFAGGYDQVSLWNSGDFDADGYFTTDDLIAAFQVGWDG